MYKVLRTYYMHMVHTYNIYIVYYTAQYIDISLGATLRLYNYYVYTY